MGDNSVFNLEFFEGGREVINCVGEVHSYF